MDILDLEKKALSLSLAERARLAEILLQSIDPVGPVGPDDQIGPIASIGPIDPAGYPSTGSSATDDSQSAEESRVSWLEEARRRDRQIDAGEASVRSAEDVFRAARARLG